MSVEILFETIDTPLPPPADGYRSAGGFRAPWSRVIGDLRDELRRADATDVRLFADLDRSQIRRDGLPYDDARPRSPGVVLALCKLVDSARVELTYPAGSYETMKGNIRAICLTLERLRDIDRYGVGKAGQQYRAYAALPPGSTALAVAEWPNAEAAERWLRQLAGPAAGALLSRVELKRMLSKRYHPDGTEPNEATFKKIVRALELIE